MPSEIAAFLRLSNPELYTGHCFRRSSASHLADAGANLTTIKKHGGWKSSTVAEGYIENSIEQKRKTSNKIFKIKNMIPEPEHGTLDGTKPSTSRQNPMLLSSASEHLVSAINLKEATNCNFSISIVNQK